MVDGFGGLDGKLCLVMVLEALRVLAFSQSLSDLVLCWAFLDL